MKKETWIYKEKDLKKALKSSITRRPGKMRWTREEEKYLMDNIAEVGIEAVSRHLKKSPIAVRSKFLRLSGLINKKGRMTVSLRNNPINKMIPVIPESKFNNNTQSTNTQSLPVSNNKTITILALTLSLISIAISVLTVLKFLI